MSGLLDPKPPVPPLESSLTATAPAGSAGESDTQVQPPPAPVAGSESAVSPQSTIESALPQLNHPAPNFEARSTHGFLRLSDFAGKWLVFFCLPADFTPVGASEIVSFSRHSEAFAALDCRLLALSVDSVFAHLAWLESLRAQFGVTIDFPILEDISLEISHRYGMVHPVMHDSRKSDVRALFVIDPAGLLRAMLHYPLTTGRSVAEVLRLLQALRIADQQQVLTPEGWQPGQDTIQSPPQSEQSAEAQRGVNYGSVDWYSYTQPTPSH